MDHACLFGFELDLAPLGCHDRLRDVHGHRANLGVGHQVAGAQDLTQAAHDRHHIGRGDAAIEFDGAALDRFHKVFGAYDIGARLFGLIGFRTTGKHGHTHEFAGAIGQVHRATYHLVGMAGIDA